MSAQVNTEVVVLALTKPARTQAADALKVDVNPARVRRHVDKRNVNKVIEAKIQTLKQEKAPYESAKELVEYGKRKYDDKGKVVKKSQDSADGKPKKVVDFEQPSEQELVVARKAVAEFEATGRHFDIEKELEALTKERIRFSNEASAVLSIVFDELIKQLLTFSMEQVLIAEKKIIQVTHMHQSGVEKLPLYPLVANLPSWLNPPDYSAAKAAKQAAVQAVEETVKSAKGTKGAKKGAKTDEKKTTKVTKKSVKDTEEVAVKGTKTTKKQTKVVTPPTDVVKEVEEGSEHDKTTFKYYITTACNKLISANPRYNHIVDDKTEEVSRIRVSTHIREYCSNLLIELIGRLSPLIQLTIEAMSVKTVGKLAVMKTVQAILVDGKPPVEELVYTTEMVLPTQKKDSDGKPVGLKPTEKVPTLVVHKKMTFNSSRFEELNALVEEKLRDFKDNGVAIVDDVESDGDDEGTVDELVKETVAKQAEVVAAHTSETVEHQKQTKAVRRVKA